MLSSENKQKARMPSTLSSLIHHGTKTPKQYVMFRQEKDMQIRKEEIKLSLFADGILSK